MESALYTSRKRTVYGCTTKFLAWISTLSLPQEDIPIVKGYILQKISVIFHALQRQPYAARKEVFRDFLTSGLAARKAELPLCGCYFHLVCRLLAAHRYRLAHLLLKTRNI